MQCPVYQTKIHSVDELKLRVIDVWCGLEQLTIDMANRPLSQKTSSVRPFERRTLGTQLVN